MGVKVEWPQVIAPKHIPPTSYIHGQGHEYGSTRVLTASRGAAVSGTVSYGRMFIANHSSASPPYPHGMPYFCCLPPLVVTSNVCNSLIQGDIPSGVANPFSRGSGTHTPI